MLEACAMDGRSPCLDAISMGVFVTDLGLSVDVCVS